MTCMDCINFKVWKGSRDRWGLQLEPDDCECKAEPTEDEIERYFCNCEDSAENCGGFYQKGDFDE